MLLYRCYPRVRGARKGRPGHWAYLPRPQRHGRWDNADLYDSWYFSRSASGAIAESFYNKRRWIPEVFLTPADEARSLAVFEFDEHAPLFDLDDARTLGRLGLRPSQVVVHDPPTTQAIARRIHGRHARDRAGLSWWSAQVPQETSVMLWGADGEPPVGVRLVRQEALSTAHPAVLEAAERLFRVVG